LLDIGIRVDGDFERLQLTIDSIARHAPGHRVVLLVPPELVDLPWSAFAPAEVVRTTRAGGATAFNALLERGGTPVAALLETGARLSAGAIDRLTAAVGDEVALAGPSTNLAWNEQRLRDAPAPGADAASLDAYAARLARRHGEAWRELSPLHSLSDFCLVFARQPLAALGGADDAYDPGPCWEMDLNVRAHRAGWSGRWVKGAYVHRALIGRARHADEVEFLLANKRRFQERFCNGYLRGGKTEHCPHCLGDACSEFAPAALVLRAGDGRGVLRRPAAAVDGVPLISAIMPTRDRPAFVMQAIRCFLAQDYPRLELIVVDDGASPIAPLLPLDPRVRYFRRPAGETIGAKRNFACEQAAGDLIAHVDDDDWYPPERLSRQARALAAPGAMVCGTSALTFLDPAADRAWLYAYPRPGWVAGATLMYRRAYWQRRRFAPLQVGEDWRFLEALRQPAELADLADPGLCVATVHGGNTSRKTVDDPLWLAIPPQPVRARVGAGSARALAAAARGEPAPALPLVSCIMPTCDRREFTALAIRKFQQQDYPNRELIVLDDGTDPVCDLVEGQPGVRYVRMDRRNVTIGEKRNICCSLARGEVICIWDDDDWYTPARLRCQVLPIAYGEADMTGLRCDHLLCLPSGEAWSVGDAVHRRMFESDVAGGTIAFHREVFEQIRFPHISLAEDAALIRMARARGFRLKHIAGHGVFAYVRHARNTWRFEAGKFYDPRAWRRVELPAAFDAEMLEAHRQACQAWLDNHPEVAGAA
jgi:glycosyltransferase involved in cell wall biosynthesis